MKAAGEAGMGGLELLGYYLYGGPPSNGAGRGTAAPVDWAVYGFGTPAWRKYQCINRKIELNELMIIQIPCSKLLHKLTKTMT